MEDGGWGHPAARARELLLVSGQRREPRARTLINAEAETSAETRGGCAGLAADHGRAGGRDASRRRGAGARPDEAGGRTDLRAVVSPRGDEGRAGRLALLQVVEHENAALDGLGLVGSEGGAGEWVDGEVRVAAGRGGGDGWGRERTRDHRTTVSVGRSNSGEAEEKQNRGENIPGIESREGGGAEWACSPVHLRPQVVHRRNITQRTRRHQRRRLEGADEPKVERRRLGRQIRL